MRVSPRAACLKLSWRKPSVRTATSGGATLMSVSKYHLQKSTQLVIQKGDITDWKGDAVVNAANERMLGGGGVDGAIHRAAGPALMEACKRYPKILSERCPTGDAKVTLAYEMPCKWIIHTVGPMFSMKKANQCREELRSAYISSLAVANGVGASTVAFPAISCGIYGYPLEQASFEAIKACWLNSGDLKEVHFVLFGSDTLDVWLAQADKHLKRVADTTEESSHASPVRDEVSPMDAVPDAAAGKDNSAAGEGTPDALVTGSGSGPPQNTGHSSLAKDEPSAMEATAASLQASETETTSSRTVQGKQDDTERQTVQTLSGVKEGEASEAPQEALGAPEVLEAAPPANDAVLSSRTESQAASQDSAAGARHGQS